MKEFNVLGKSTFVDLVTFLYDFYCLLVFGICAFISNILNICMEPIARCIARKQLLGYAFVTRAYIWSAVVVYLNKEKKLSKETNGESPQR